MEPEPVILDLSNSRPTFPFTRPSNDLTTDGEWELENVLAPSISEIYDAGSDEEDFFASIEHEEEQRIEVEEEDITATTTETGDGWNEGAMSPIVPPFDPIDRVTGARKTPGPQLSMPRGNMSPLAFFRLFVTTQVMAAIAEETNRYARLFLNTTTLSANSRFHSWYDTTPDEMWAFFGLITAMGLIQISDLQDYWSTDVLYDLRFFPSTMTRDRFLNLLTFFHVNNNDDFVPRGQPGHDPLFKVAPFISSIKETFFKNWYPSMNIAIDEAMIAWRGNLSFRVFNPEKPDKFGIKIFQLCDSDNAYCSKFEIYTGKRETSSKGATYDTVMRLISPFLGCGHRLYVDNFYTSPILLEDLLEAKTTACGTLRLNRRGLAKDMQKKKLVKRKGDSKIMNSGKMNHLKFMDRKEVNMLTSIHSDSKSQTGRRDRVTDQPQVKFDAVIDYNKYMGAVDRSDQMIQYNAFKRRTLKWWKKTFFHLFMLAELNTYLFYKACMKGIRSPMSHREFRRELAKEMVQLSPTYVAPGKRTSAHPGDSILHRLTARHFPSKVTRPANKPLQTADGKKARVSTRICVVCSVSTGKRRTNGDRNRRRETTVQCTECDVGLCNIPCFGLFHTQKDYKRAWRRLQETERNVNEDQEHE